MERSAFGQSNLAKGERCLAVGKSAVHSLSLALLRLVMSSDTVYVLLVARIQEVQIACKNETVTNRPQGFVHFSAVAVGRSIV